MSSSRPNAAMFVPQTRQESPMVDEMFDGAQM
jgi:hypothetical protein